MRRAQEEGDGQPGVLGTALQDGEGGGWADTREDVREEAIRMWTERARSLKGLEDCLLVNHMIMKHLLTTRVNRDVTR